jgi:2-phosphoglycerate kinase
MPARHRLVVTRDRAFPFSKGMLAQSLMACGIAPDRAHRIARIIEVELRRGDAALVTVDELRGRTEAVLGREEGDGAVDRYRRWNELTHLELPLIVLVGGAPGTGKSTIASQVAHRLGITRIVSTDVVRQVMRGVIAADVLPQIHVSSFDAGQLILHGEPADRTIAGFRQQADTVRAGLRNVVVRAVEERFPLVLEGVHVVPGAPLVAPDEGAIVAEVVLALASEDEHQSHFELRAAHTGDARPAERYLEAFDAIRHVHDFLVAEAHRTGTPVVEASDIDRAVRDVMDVVLDRVAQPVR